VINAPLVALRTKRDRMIAIKKRVTYANVSISLKKLIRLLDILSLLTRF